MTIDKLKTLFVVLVLLPLNVSAIELPYYLKAEGVSTKCERSVKRAIQLCESHGGSCYHVTASRIGGNAANAFIGQVVIDGKVKMLDGNQKQVNEETLRVKQEGYICKKFEATPRDCLKWNKGAFCTRISSESTWSSCYCASERPDNDLLGTTKLLKIYRGAVEESLPVVKGGSKPVPIKIQKDTRLE